MKKNLIKRLVTAIMLIYGGSITAQISTVSLLDHAGINIENTIIDASTSPDFKYEIDYTTPSTGGPYKITIAQYGRIESEGTAVWLKTIVSVKDIEEGFTGSINGDGIFVTENDAKGTSLYSGNGYVYIQMQDADKNYIGEAVKVPVTWDFATSISLGETLETEVYPNPANQLLHINVPEGSTVSIYSLTGTKVSDVEESTISVASWDAGIYIVKVAYQGESIIKKIQVL
ncbi:T9SS type A sorting domain-containing protein [Saccharicrinis aurantiacus]|uniref:T9SS type A sorting domain-containing protein n=1 Tax=Saccharicrinis aurantiacus TaxID=1849719 RepID=UPI00083993CD|nr:T9SS type A sorting domain-containing protein [Saccharicrinis aurantiacus]